VKEYYIILEELHTATSPKLEQQREKPIHELQVSVHYHNTTLSHSYTTPSLTPALTSRSPNSPGVRADAAVTNLQALGIPPHGAFRLVV
jgi:hypothetical protein